MEEPKEGSARAHGKRDLLWHFPSGLSGPRDDTGVECKSQRNRVNRVDQHASLNGGYALTYSCSWANDGQVQLNRPAGLPQGMKGET